MMKFEIWIFLAIFNVVSSQGASCDISGLCNVTLIKSLTVKQLFKLYFFIKVQFFFQGELIHLESDLANKIGCWVLCRNTAECNWFTFDTEDNDCLLFKTCSALDEDLKFITGQVECDYTTQYCKYF